MSSPSLALESPDRARSAASDARIIAVVCVGHFFSHFYTLVLPPLFPVLRAELGFGFVYSGLDLGTLVMPPIYGWLIDRGAPRVVFVVAAVLMALTILTVLEVGRQGAAARVRGA